MRNLTLAFTLLLNLAAVDILPPGNACAAPTGIPTGESSYTGSTRGLSDDYEIGSYGTDTPDGVFGLSLPPGGSFQCEMQHLGCDFVLYLVTDCSDPDGSSVAFSDGDPEDIDYTNDTGSMNWGDLKLRY